MDHLVRQPPSGILRRSFRFQGASYAREIIAETRSMRDALATVPMTRTGS